jgi:hypothetical protein
MRRNVGRLTLKLACLAVLAAALAIPAAAQADITVSGVQAAPKETPAGAHSDFTLKFDLGGSESIRDLDVNLPAGLIGNPNSAPKCTEAQFQADSCPAESKVGTQTVNSTAAGLLTTDTSGEVFNLVPHTGEPARLGIRLDTPGSTTHLESVVSVRSPDSGLTSTIRGIPNNLMGIPIHINSISLTLLAQSGAKKPFMTNPTSCDPAVTTLHVVGDGNSAADGQASFTPTACDALPYAPALTATAGGAGQNGVGKGPPLTTVISQGDGEAATKSAVVDISAPLTPNTGAIKNVCSTSDYAADTCPPASQVGQATAITPVLATPLAGPVRIVENPGGLPKLVVYLNGLINVRLQGDIALTPQGSTTTFASIPDVPLSRFELAFSGGPDGLLTTSSNLCTAPVTLGGHFTSHSGKHVDLTAPVAVSGCRPAPRGSVSLRRLATRNPLLGVRVGRSPDGQPVRSITMTVPRGLSFVRKKLRTGVAASTDAGKLRRGVSLRGSRVLRIAAPAASGADRIAAIVSRGALKVSRALRARVAGHPQVVVTVRATDAKGRAFTLRKSVTLR